MKRRTVKPAEVWPNAWRDLLTPLHPVAIGYDVATTTKKLSNPSAAAVVQKIGVDFAVRAVCKWKTSDPAVSEAIIDDALFGLPHGLRIRRLCIDATNEKFFAADQKKRLSGKIVCELIVSSETKVYAGEEMNWKSYLGNLLVNTADDGHLLLPNETWLRNDLRMVKTEKGLFTCEPDEEGNHGDCFDAIKLALHGVIGAGGPAEASAAQVGGYGAKAPPRPGIRNPFAHLFGRT